MTYSFATRKSTSISVTIPVAADTTGAVLTAEFSKTSAFATISKTKTPPASGKTVTLSLTAAEVDSLADTFYRVKSVKAGVTSYIQSGAIDYVAPKNLTGLRSVYGSREMQALQVLRGSDDVRRRAPVIPSGLTPIITQGTGEFWASGITNGVQIPWTDPRLRYTLSRVVDSAAIGVAGTSYACAQNTPRSLAWPFPGGNPLRVEFVYRGQVLAFGTRYNSAKWRLWIDGQPTSIDSQAFTTINSTERQVRIDFGSRAERRIAIEGETDFYFRGLYIEPTGVIAPDLTPLGPRVSWMTDSFGQGGGLTYGVRGYNVIGSRLCGWGDIDRTECVGSTGYVNLPAPNSSGFQAYPGRVASLVTGKPDIVVVQGSRNDTAWVADNSIRDAAVTVLTAVREALPDAWIIATGPLYIETPPAGATTNQNQIRTAYDTVFGTPGDVNVTKRVAFINTLSPVLAGGTGRVGATTGDGPADYLRSSDQTHPSAEGHAFLETWWAGQVDRIARTARGQIT